MLDICQAGLLSLVLPITALRSCNPDMMKRLACETAVIVAYRSINLFPNISTLRQNRASKARGETEFDVIFTHNTSVSQRTDQQRLLLYRLKLIQTCYHYELVRYLLTINFRFEYSDSKPDLR